MALLLVFSLALALRFIFLSDMYRSPLFSLLFIDSQGYDNWASRIAAGDWLGSGIFYQAPLYPYFLGCIYTVVGHSLMAARLFQILLGSLACVFLAMAGRHFFGSRVGIVAGCLLACYPTAIFFDYLIQKSVLDLFLLCLLLLFLGRTLHADPVRVWLPVGATLGALALTRENSAIFILIVFVYLMMRLRHSRWPTIAGHAGMLLLGIAILLLPVAVRNRITGGEFIITTFQGGTNFFIGNNPAARGTYVPLRPARQTPENERTDAHDLAEQAVGHPLTTREVSRYWLSKGFEFILAHPLAWLRLMGRKAMLLVNVVELADADDQYTYGDWSILLRWLTRIFSFGVLFPLAACGAFLTRYRRNVRILLVMAFSYAASILVFYVFARYRFPLVPFLVLFAAAGLVEMSRSFRQGTWRTLMVPIILMLTVATVANWPVAANNKKSARVVTLNNIVHASLNNNGRADDVAPLLQEALYLDQTNSATFYNLGRVSTARGQIAEAISFFQKAIVYQPQMSDSYAQLGLIYYNLGQAKEAVLWFEKALLIDPKQSVLHQQVAMAMARSGRMAEVRAHFAEAIRLSPQDPLISQAFGETLWDVGRRDEAQAHFDLAMRLYEEILRRKPDDEDAHLNLGTILFRYDRLEEASRHFEEALRINPNSVDAHFNLALVKKKQGRYQETVIHLQEASRLDPRDNEIRNLLLEIDKPSKTAE